MTDPAQNRTETQNVTRQNVQRDTTKAKRGKAKKKKRMHQIILLVCAGYIARNSSFLLLSIVTVLHTVPSRVCFQLIRTFLCFFFFFFFFFCIFASTAKRFVTACYRTCVCE